MTQQLKCKRKNRNFSLTEEETEEKNCVYLHSMKICHKVESFYMNLLSNCDAIEREENIDLHSTVFCVSVSLDFIQITNFFLTIHN